MNTQNHPRRPGLQRATGRDYDDWFVALDEWGAPGREFREISDWLVSEHGFTKWWAQKVIVEYEQARGLRPAGARADGTFTVGASKTVAARVDVVRTAFADADVREQWLPGVKLNERTTDPGRTSRFDYGDEGTRLNVSFDRVNDAKTQVAVEHERLPDAQLAQDRKAFWRDRLNELKRLLEN